MASASMPRDTSAAPQPKPIRFVTNTDGPYAKRRRITSACLTCRRRKTRCSGEKPQCMTCLTHDHVCAGYGPETESSPGEDVGNRRASKEGSRGENGVKRKSSYGQSQLQRPQSEHPASSRPSLDYLLSTASSATNMSDAPRRSTNPEEILSGSSVAMDSTNRAPLSLSTRNRMPYFRYFGPTAIMPGFKQMVVKVKGRQQSTNAGSTDQNVESPPPPGTGSSGMRQYTPSHSTSDIQPPVDLPLYDSSAVAPPSLITTLCRDFFAHLGCNFPFLQKERFMRDLEEKQVDAILVDSVCALAARFSNDPILARRRHEDVEDNFNPPKQEVHSPSDYGAAFAQRAQSAIADTFACPSVAVVQAALLLAYNEFGASRDSGLWMYLGIAIRMAQDLGMQTLQGLKYEGRDGPTAQSIKLGQPKNTNARQDSEQTQTSGDEPDRKAVERERLDTFWAVFFLDRVISSGTGRPVTLRDRDIEISFPSLDAVDTATGWPAPFPALIRVIHLYGRVTDLLNSIKEVSDVTPDVIKRLASMESHLTEIYQNLSSRLHFNVLNFQHYLKNGQGTNFILLHFWFHTLIVLLHQPTLLKTFEGGIQQLLPNSRELSMSSAKTIADILAFAELADAKAGLGNPFTSQPIYIAACAFLKETAIQSASSNPHSRQTTPPSNRAPPTPVGVDAVRIPEIPIVQDTSAAKLDQKQKMHTLLATAANQNYQRCYRALQSLETYWAGTKYILTVLDQKAKGVGDPLLYTREEMESALELPRPEPSFTSPGWRRKLSWGTYIGLQNGAESQSPVAALISKGGSLGFSAPGSPVADSSQGGSIASTSVCRAREDVADFWYPTAIGWSLTGTMNSPSTSLAVLYPTEARDSNGNKRMTTQDHRTNPSISSIMAAHQDAHQQQHNLLTSPNPSLSIAPSTLLPSPHPPLPRYPGNAQIFAPPRNMLPPQAPHHHQQPSTNTLSPSSYNISVSASDPALVSDADLLLNLHSPFVTTAPSPTHAAPTSPHQPHHPHSQSQPQHLPNPLPPALTPDPHITPSGSAPMAAADAPAFSEPMPITFADMMIESQDIDMSALALGDGMLPWLEYLPHEMLSFFEPTGGAVQEGIEGGEAVAGEHIERGEGGGGG